MPAVQSSYWIYETYYVDSNGNGSPGGYWGAAPAIDSFYQAADTTIDGKLFRCLMKPSGPGDTHYIPFYYRDSASYLIGLDGRIFFSHTDTNHVFWTWIHGEPQHVTSDSAITAGGYAGNARTVWAQDRSILTLAGVVDWAVHPFAKDQRPVQHRRQYTRFARNIGIVYETLPIFFGDPGYVERRLLRSRVIYPVE